MKVGINGFGRIGKNIYKILVSKGYEVPLINDPFIDLEYLAYLMKFDTAFLKDQKEIKMENGSVLYDKKRTYLSGEKNPKDIKWAEYDIDCVIESSGIFLDLKSVKEHNCKTVILTAPSSDIPMYVFGVNHEDISKTEKMIISAASCTTNCLAPIAKLINDKYEIEESFMTTVHSLTASQSVVDSKGRKRRSARSAFNIIPASTGATQAVTKVISGLEGKITGMAFRVPVINSSVIDFVVKVKKETNLKEIEKEVKKLDKKIIQATSEEIVSSDIIGNSSSCILDLKASIELNRTFFKLICWYDNEHGYSCRVVDLLEYILKL